VIVHGFRCSTVIYGSCKVTRELEWYTSTGVVQEFTGTGIVQSFRCTGAGVKKYMVT